MKVFFFFFLFITLLFLIVFYCCCVFLHRWLCVMKNALRVLRTAWRLVRTTFCFENWEKLSKVKSFNLVFIKLISHHLKKNNFKILVAINITWFKAGQFNFQKNLLKLARLKDKFKRQSELCQQQDTAGTIAHTLETVQMSTRGSSQMSDQPTLNDDFYPTIPYITTRKCY